MHFRLLLSFSPSLLSTIQAFADALMASYYSKRELLANNNGILLPSPSEKLAAVAFTFRECLTGRSDTHISSLRADYLPRVELRLMSPFLGNVLLLSRPGAVI